MFDTDNYYYQQDGGSYGGIRDFALDYDGYNDSYTGGFDYDDFIAPSDGGYPGGIPGYDDYVVGQLAPVAPTGGGAIDQGVNPDSGAVRMEFTGMAPGSVDVSQPGDLDFGPGAVNVPSGGVYDIFDQNPAPVIDFSENPYTSPETPNTPYTPLDVTPGPLPDWYTDPNTTADNYQPVDTSPVYTGPGITDSNDYTVPMIDSPTLDLPDLTPYIPVDTVPEMTITDNRPAVDDVPEMTITDNRPVTDEVPEMTITDTRPVVPDDIPEMTITDTRPVVDDVPEMVITDTRPVVPDEIPEMEIVAERPVTPVEPDIVEEPVVEPEPEPEPPVLPPVLPPILPPIVTPPPVTPRPPVVPKQASDGFLNPGMIETTPFYQTTNDTQSKYYWGDRQLQYGTEFDPYTWNDVPQAPKTAWGVQEFGKPMSLQQAMGILQGTASYPELSPAEQAYLVMLDPVGQEQFLTRKGLAKKR